MLRYRTRDVTRLSDEPCPCGRTHVRILRVTGRNDDMLIVRGVNVYPSQVEAALVGLAGLAPFYRLILQRDGSLDVLTVEVECLPHVPPDAHERLAAAVGAELRARVGLTARVVVLPPGELPRSEGKAVRVRDLRKL